MRVARSGATLVPLAIALAGAVIAAQLVLPAFVGTSSPSQQPTARTTATQLNGYRLDRMFENFVTGKSRGELETAEGWWTGEKGLKEAMNERGLRYNMRATTQEIKEAAEKGELDKLGIYEFGPIKIRFGEMLGGTGINDKAVELKKKLAEAPLDPKLALENEEWIKKYGHPRHERAYIDQATGKPKVMMRGLAAWSGYDPLDEERNADTWVEADWPSGWKKPRETKNDYLTADRLTPEAAASLKKKGRL